MSKHAQKFSELLTGKTIASARYLNKEEMEDFGWYANPLLIEFTDGSALCAMRDDEGNDGGAMTYWDDKGEPQTIYVT